MDGRYENPPYYITAYGLWLKAGNTGTVEDFLASLKGEQGDPGEGVPEGGTTGQIQDGKP